VTRGNENTNSLGVQYKDHVLSCRPRKGSVVRFKPGIFVKCKLKGSISREDKFGGHNDPRPKIIVDDVIPLEVDDAGESLFNHKN